VAARGVSSIAVEALLALIVIVVGVLLYLWVGGAVEAPSGGAQTRAVPALRMETASPVGRHGYCVYVYTVVRNVGQALLTIGDPAGYLEDRLGEAVPLHAAPSGVHPLEPGEAAPLRLVPEKPLSEAWRLRVVSEVGVSAWAPLPRRGCQRIT
jgi:hypothetical protein